MSIDFGDSPIGTPPSAAEAKQIKLSISAIPTVSLYTTPTGGSISSASLVDETIFLESVTASPVSLINLSLPSVANSVVGQVKVFISSKLITTLNVSIDGGGTFAGNILTGAIANEAYSFQFISDAGAGRWLRLS